ncbi:MAG: tRNA uridine-5-carboxymethylaminomethyl(34) synthesis GTPase MnmE, partial [Paraprevotella sp.]|nr:tRNA uridine-5-carboxymethylaminomethyl(34) synthesis GTPase MnmE [Paraprevotella sp.]
MNNHQDTICAISTAQGGAIGVIRVSGSEAIAITSKIFVPLNNIPLEERKAYTLIFGKIMGDNNEMIDEVLVSLFRAPHSYTGEDAVEISCHGSTYILQQIMQRLIHEGCRMAKPGEYTQRAFLNGKMDLSQAEAVADLIASSSAATHRLAMNQMRGGFSKELSELRNKLLHLTSLMELELDFSDHEELEFADRSELQSIADEIEHLISKLTDSFSIGNAIKNGIPVAIIGETNAGKSTLLNALLNEEKAIVSDIHGTTRDVIEDTINIQGITFRFIDTAGIRETSDTIESIGIKRTFEKLEQANIVLWMIDGKDNKNICTLKEELLPLCEGKQLIILFNKTDLLNEQQRADLTSSLSDIDAPQLFISAKSGNGLSSLENKLVETAHIPEISQNDIIVTNVRHYEALTLALSAIHRVQEGLTYNLSGDFISQDLRECIHHLSDIAGEVTTD